MGDGLGMVALEGVRDELPMDDGTLESLLGLSLVGLLVLRVMLLQNSAAFAWKSSPGFSVAMKLANCAADMKPLPSSFWGCAAAGVSEDRALISSALLL